MPRISAVVLVSTHRVKRSFQLALSFSVGISLRPHHPGATRHLAEQAGLEPAHRNPSVNGLAIRRSTCYAYCPVYKARGRFERPSVGQIGKPTRYLPRHVKRDPGLLPSLLCNFVFTSIAHQNQKVFRFFSGFQISVHPYKPIVKCRMAASFFA